MEVNYEVGSSPKGLRITVQVDKKLAVFQIEENKVTAYTITNEGVEVHLNQQEKGELLSLLVFGYLELVKTLARKLKAL